MKKLFYLLFIALSFSCSKSDDSKNNDDLIQDILEYNPFDEGCLIPDNLNASPISDTYATIQWVDSNGSNLFNIEYGDLGFTLGSGTAINSNDNYKTITNLTSATTYDFYVRANCGGSETSEWAGPHSFVTD